MNQGNFEKERLLDLVGGLLDGWIDESGREELARTLKAHPGARRIYCQQMDLHARLHLDFAGGLASEFIREIDDPPSLRRFPGKELGWAAIVACLAVGVFFLWPRPADPKLFATVESSQAAKWEGSDLPTTEGSRLGKGSLRLIEGVVSLQFDSGAKVTIEAPADLSLNDARHCSLMNGSAMVEIGDSAKGFRVTTPEALISDFGTRFSVVVDERAGSTQTQVYEGSVEVEHTRSGKTVNLHPGQGNLTRKEGFSEDYDPEDSNQVTTIGPPPRGLDWKLLRTNKDAYIGRAFVGKWKEVHRSESLLLVKNGSVHRVAFLGFDLSGIDPSRLIEAKLELQFEPTGWGLASLVPDATFGVYGLISNAPWDEGSLNVRNSPAIRRGLLLNSNLASGSSVLERARVRGLGSFVIEMGVQRGEFGIEGEVLAEFLRERAGSEITLIVVRETRELDTNGLVHGFASSRHPTLRPPTLAIRMKSP